MTTKAADVGGHQPLLPALGITGIAQDHTQRGALGMGHPRSPRIWPKLALSAFLLNLRGLFLPVSTSVQILVSIALLTQGFPASRPLHPSLSSFLYPLPNSAALSISCTARLWAGNGKRGAGPGKDKRKWEQKAR